MSSAVAEVPESLHPSIWRASQLARSTARCIDTGYPPLSAQLPGNGWPTGALVELLIQQHGLGEMRLLKPALCEVAKRKIILLQPPQSPQITAFAGMGIEPSELIWLRPKTTADTLWAAELVLRSNSTGALLLWQTQVRNEALRRLHLAANTSETLLFMMRPLAAGQDASPAPLRLALRPQAGGIEIDFVKRKGPVREERLFLPLNASILEQRAPSERHQHAPGSVPAVSTQLVI